MAITITEVNFEKEIKQATKPVILDVFAPWCGVCQQMEPIFNEIEKELGSKYTFAKLNVDEVQELATREYGIQSVPTFVLLKGGNVVEKLHGYQAKEDFIQAIKKAFA